MIAAIADAMWHRLVSVFGLKKQSEQTMKVNTLGANSKVAPAYQTQILTSSKVKLKNNLRDMAKPTVHNLEINNSSLQKDLLNAILGHNPEKLKAWIIFVKENISKGKIRNPDINLTLTIQDGSTKYETFPLIAAAASSHDNNELIDELINAGADPHLKDSHQMSAVMVAATKGLEKKFTRLLKVSRNEIEFHFDQLLRSVIESDRPSMLQIFIQHLTKHPEGLYSKVYQFAKELRAKRIQEYLVKHNYVRSDEELVARLEAMLQAA